MDKDYEVKMREILECEHITEEESAQMVFEFMVSTMMQMLKNSK